jgi:FKBP-type peptidyl-prolyl cis-trans isomerase FkpA
MVRPAYCLVFAAAVIALAAAGCGSTTTGPSGGGQLVLVDIVVGQGATAANGNTVNVTYTGWLYDASKVDYKGSQFDSGPYTFSLGAGQVIAGWDQGILGMKVGGKRLLTIPPDLAYGAQGRPPAIPGNATLLFEVTLVSVS